MDKERMKEFLLTDWILRVEKKKKMDVVEGLDEMNLKLLLRITEEI
jgi:hypothetical protein